jgi:lipopolysaccharide transport system ATP-binding protein
MGSLTVTNLGKAYKQYSGRWSRLLEWITPGNAKHHQLKWVLQGITFSVQPGEAVGIIGINGAGKSTLLKLITGTTQPTTGSVHMTGRVAAMLELGMGFHPDFTGRQNAFMAGQLLGIASEDIARLMPEIEAFAEIGDYIDQPVRVYSSGMQMRLAFSVATAQRPDVLIVDEALSVGDTYFQHKSFNRIRELRKSGTTLLLVSHDKGAIQSICDRAILLNAGLVAMEGDPEAVMDYYNAITLEQQNQNIILTDTNNGKMKIDLGNFEANIEKIELLNKQREPIEIITVGEQVIASIKVKINAKIKGLILGFGVKDRLGQMMFGTNTHYTKQKISALNIGETIQIDACFQANLGVGSYSIHCSLVANENFSENIHHWIDRALVFQVINKDKPVFIGCTWNQINFKITKNSGEQYE